MIDVSTESLLTMTAATKEIPGRPNISTLWRWRTSGVRGILLETTLIGGRRYTSREAVERFLAAINGEQTTPVASVAQQQSAELEADRLGI